MEASPDVINDTADLFGVDLQEEPYLCWIMREFVLNPLPPNYSKAINERGEDGYVNDITGEGSSEHPAMRFFAGLIEKERAKQQEVHLMRSTSGVSKSPMNSLSLDKTSLGEGGVDFSPIPPRSISPQTLPSLVESNPSLTNQWMEFNTEEGKYYHNFYSGNTTATLTPAMNVIQAPVAMKKNQNLLRAKSDFMPRLLRFRSWWQETKSFEGGIERNEIEIIFDTLTNELKIKSINGLDTASEYSCDNVDNLTFLDFHVDAVLNIMGRPTTLMQAALETQRWYDIEFKKLTKVRDRLRVEIRKYDIKAATSRPPASPTKGSKVKSLRYLVEQCEHSATKLYQLRPVAVDMVLQALLS